MIRNYQDLTRLEMEQLDRENTVVMIPCGALEQHGNQLPLGTDDIITEAAVRRLVQAVEKDDPDYPMLVFPLIPVGLSTEHKNFCGSITFRPDTYYHLLYDVCASLARHGFKKLIIFNSHGGNTPVQQLLSRELRSEFGIAVFLMGAGVAFGNADVRATVTPGNVWDFHGGEMETDMVLAERPELVHLETAEAGVPRCFAGNRTVTLYGPVTMNWVSEDFVTAEGKPIGIGGDPAGATAEKGEIIYASAVRTLLPAMAEIKAWKDR